MSALSCAASSLMGKTWKWLQVTLGIAGNSGLARQPHIKHTPQWESHLCYYCRAALDSVNYISAKCVNKSLGHPTELCLLRRSPSFVPFPHKRLYAFQHWNESEMLKSIHLSLLSAAELALFPYQWDLSCWGSPKKTQSRKRSVPSPLKNQCQ